MAARGAISSGRRAAEISERRDGLKIGHLPPSCAPTGDPTQQADYRRFTSYELWAIAGCQTCQNKILSYTDHQCAPGYVS